MALFELLFKTITQSGGNSALSKNKSIVFLYIFIFGIILLLIKSYLVELSYNYIMPKIIQNNSEKTVKSFRKLTFGEGLILVILVQSLVK